MSETPAKKSDLGVRTLSAVVMLAVSGIALWLGGWWWAVFVAAVAFGVLWEWWGLVTKFTQSGAARSAWLIAGLIYIATATRLLAQLGSDQSTSEHWSRSLLIGIILLVIGTDVGAYFAGRTIGGPKIAPKISPSKTWAGLVGGIMGAFLALWVFSAWTASSAGMSIGGFEVAGLFTDWRQAVLPCLVAGGVGAIIAQTGDFFESWMKRRAGVKDSGNLIPGHGGLFDRVDGLLAVLFVIGIFQLISAMANL